MNIMNKCGEYDGRHGDDGTSTKGEGGTNNSNGMNICALTRLFYLHDDMKLALRERRKDFRH